ncbi:MMPL family transporter [Nocardioides perillae]|uniref:RND superfamily putative drug exporter n=1 Tax=Nocardioides perillae TaxID=1119534 RepID=A0A7Y9RU99_9ACTN|nr:MMPL family transporter [Nocardioides perillae]NYG54249.1 RND superfamily putative drug exporter [Nocardioides perillae]
MTHRPAHAADRGPLAALLRTVTGRRTAWLVALLPLLLAGGLAAALGEGERAPSPLDTLPAGYESTLGTELAAELPADDASVALVLWTATEGQLPGGALGELGALAQEVGAVGGPRAVRPSEDGTAALAVVPVPGGSATDVAERVTELRENLDEGVPDGVEAQVTGPAAVQADLAAVFDGADFRLLGATAAVVAVLLVVTYRSPVLWLVPLTVVAVADRFAAVAATQLMAQLGIAWDESTVGILSVLVFGAGTDYALLLISRYRDELKRVADRRAAMATAVRRTAEAVVASATTVVLGVLTLLLSLVPTTRGLGFACAVGIVVAAVFALVVLPAALVCFGRWVFWPRVPREGDPTLVEGRSLWRRVGDQVAARPPAFVVGSVVVLAALAAGLAQVSTGLDQSDQFLERPEAIAAADRLAESFPAGTSSPTQVVTRAAAGDVLATVRSTGAVLSADVTDQGDGVSQVDVVLDAAPSSPEAEEAIASLRAELAGYEDTYVTGTEAQAIDARDGAARDRLVIFPLILALVLVGLGVLLRSVVAPVLLVATVVATYAAALGVSWWVFTGVLGFEALDVSTPLLAFLFLVALGVDYNIFLVTRAREEAEAGHGTRAGVLRALTATGGVITSAGVLLAAVFAVLGVLPLVVLAQIGTVICIGVLLDTLLVRTVLVPALVVVLGDRFWWPRRTPPATATTATTPAPAPM